MANAYDIGDLVRVSVAFKDGSGVPADPDTITLKLLKPGGIESTGAPVKDSTGNYHYDVPTDASGTWYYRWEGTGAVEAAEEGSFFVRVSAF